jgi:hypothetical protein
MMCAIRFIKSSSGEARRGIYEEMRQGADVQFVQIPTSSE